MTFKEGVAMQEKLPATLDLEAIARQNLGRIRRNLAKSFTNSSLQ